MTIIARHHIPGLELIDHEFELPLRHQDAHGRQIHVFAREVVAVEHIEKDLPWLVFLQGGPGSGAPRPMGRAGWLGHAVSRFRVLLLDQRGTARSSRIDAATLALEGSPQAQADYLTCFRADAIVRDAEWIRRELCGDTPWTILGQSFGGFCALNYLSFFPEGLAGALITGGIPPVGVPIDEVYRATYRRVVDRNHRYYQRYPDDVHVVRDIVRHLNDHEVTLPGGARLTPQVLQLAGLQFGFSDGFESVHYLLEQAFTSGKHGPTLPFNFLHDLDHLLSFETNPLFAVLHEAIYCENKASNWSAQRVREEYPEFNADADPVMFTGEMIYPWMFEVFPRLSPLREAAELLAAHDAWTPLYHEETLARNKVPVAAAVYADDMYVERRYSEAVAARVPEMRIWLTNEWDHNALRSDGNATVFKRLLDMLDGQV